MQDDPRWYKMMQDDGDEDDDDDHDHDDGDGTCEISKKDDRKLKKKIEGGQQTK